MVAMVLVAVLAVALIVGLLAWMPWDNNNDTNTGGGTGTEQQNNSGAGSGTEQQNSSGANVNPSAPAPQPSTGQ